MLFLIPFILVSVAGLIPIIAMPVTLIALFTAAIGIWTERWLFFAEAKHVVMNYYDG